MLKYQLKTTVVMSAGKLPVCYVLNNNLLTGHEY